MWGLTGADFATEPEPRGALGFRSRRGSAGPRPARPPPARLWPRPSTAPPLGPAHRRSARGRRLAGSHQDTRTLRRPAEAHSGRSRSGTRLNPPPSCPLLRRENADVNTNPSDGRGPRHCPSLYTHLAGAFPAAGDSRPRRNCSHSATSGSGTLRGQGVVRRLRRRFTPAPAPNSLPGNPSRAGSPAPRGGHGRHWAPQPRPWRQQQSSKVRAGPARGPAHMPSSPRWLQHTSRRSGARSAKGDPASGRSALPRSNPPSGEPRPRVSRRRTGLWRAQDDPCPHRPGSRGAGSRGQRARAPRAGGTRSGRSPAG